MLTPVSVDHAPPAFVEYHHVPFVVTTAVTAKPFTAPLSPSVKLATKADTSVPGLLPSATSSTIVVSVLAAATGASFTVATLTCTGTALAEADVPSRALIVKAFNVPFASAAGVHTRLSPALSSVAPGVTATPLVANVTVHCIASGLPA